MLARADVLSGLMFIAIAAFGLWASRNYPVGTALRMGTGYVPRLLCWLLLGLGVDRPGAGPARAGARRCAPSPQALARACCRVTAEPRGVRPDASSGSGWSLAILLLTGDRRAGDARAAAAGDRDRRRWR